ncbi:hypothetical protein A3F00_02045 [Candidatus Daviesbacteria bacterium RIFCSPHIGHO2_12_FULL_37_11]|uniref:Uncharacterized protein n=1 Tax=Candidatus Daviesbacteria bacterium RIFCSPHIGHO2_12_FULL_37_11 TaxID=1797777 RepID=A0A1F5KEM1_9BACT|nr:MAG: hypothetical protein A2769_03200 [Candidatus Daviesbacteria bacterium RIFCSPHIGHO2_01_FULL_37_27]OGE39393.1 MAG: hypothetical protein A3F00_02045 [Candidatus Daviesbacteria bacterium RIFCSPHIGHO2_12_FULL_37_11]OGE45034.1 MAG: hypothetical protein A3B39_05530 [Candidatus Daviesbacteria bacterium RIFCSPLOWO2_01_FULL_37_10]
MNERVEPNYQDLIRAAMLLQSDRPINSVDTIYLHGLSEGMINSTHPNLFEIAADYQRSKKAGCISFNGSDGEGMGEQNYPGAAWPGKDWYFRKFNETYVGYYDLIPTGLGLHTRDEADKFIILSKEKAWTSGGILSVGYHSVRSMSCMVAAMETQNYFMRLHFIMPPSTDPWYPMLGSQGIDKTNTFTEIESEVSRIFNYWEKGYGASPKYLFHYLQYREEIVKQQKFPLFPLTD